VKVGVPAEVKDGEFRVAVTPAGVHELARAGHQVFVEAGAGAGSALPDEEFAAAGATILRAAGDVWAAGDLILKVEPPVPAEHARMRPGQVLFSFLRLAASRELAAALLSRRVTAIACETVRLPDGGRPLLAPMSEVAGRMAAQVGAHHLHGGGRGRGALLDGALLGSAQSGRAARVVVLGAGTAGMNAAAIALGMGAEVQLLDRDPARLRRANVAFRGRCQTAVSSAYEVERAVWDADLVIGAACDPGAKAPTLVSNQLVAKMKPGSVLVDIAVDQGGCFADSLPATHANPTYRVHDSLFYCVANMPGAVPHTSTYALAHVTFPYALQIANRGWRGALRDDQTLAHGLNTHGGAVACPPVAEVHDLPHTDAAKILA
jgi:alanine dehydrogenase